VALVWRVEVTSGGNVRDVGFVTTSKENERRRALTPTDAARTRHPGSLLFESGYGLALGFNDEDYVAAGARVVSQAEAWGCPVVCSMKTPEPREVLLLGEGQTIFGWMHAVQSRGTADMLVDRRMTAVAWEDMFEGSRHVFCRNNALTGEAGVMHASLCWGRTVGGLKAAVLGYGNVGTSAARTLERMGAEVTVYKREDEATFRREFGRFDVIVNAVLWDVLRSGRLLWREDLARMKPGSAIFDFSCDDNLEIETTRGTTIADPVYVVDGILHYAVDHVPALVWQTASESISTEVCRFVDSFVEGSEDESDVLRGATIVRGGEILDRRIIEFQCR
jgi:N5-(carboxyethyl)ornithine synthase